MRCLFLLVLFSSLAGFSRDDHQKQNGRKNLNTSTTPVNRFKVEIEVTQTSSYCGGAKPSEEVLKKLETPRPLTGKKLFIKKGDKNTFISKVLLRISTDSLGKIAFDLPAGKYLIVDEFKKDPGFYKTLIKEHKAITKEFTPIEKQCLKAWYEQPDLIFEVTNKDLKNLILNFNKNCSWNNIPCFQFKGFLPQ